MISRYTIRQYAWNLFVNGVIMSYLIPAELRILLLKMLGCKIGGGNTSALFVINE